LNQELKHALTQEEVQALQEAISSGEVSTEQEEGGSGGSFSAYDFSRHQHHSSMHLPVLDGINDRFGRILRATFLTRFGLPSAVSPAPIKETGFREFLNTVSDPTCMVLFTITPPGGPALLTMEANLALFFVDRLCGGSGGQTKGSERMEFQEIGQSLIRKVALYMLGDLEKSWRPIFPVNMELERLQFNPRYFEATAPEEFQGATVGLMSVEVKSEPSQGTLYLCLPRSTLQSLANVSHQKADEEGSRLEPEWAVEMKENLDNVRLNISVELGKTVIKVRNFLSLKEGSVIQLAKNVSDDLVVKVEGIEKFRGHPGKSRGCRALQLTTTLDEGS
jgi:flagellar motor switch protein FliM